MEAFEHALTKFLERGRLCQENRHYREHLEEALKRTRKLQATNLRFNNEFNEQKALKQRLKNSLGTLKKTIYF